MGTVSSVKVHCLRKLQSNKRKVAVMSPYSKRLQGFTQQRVAWYYKERSYELMISLLYPPMIGC